MRWASTRLDSDEIERDLRRFALSGMATGGRVMDAWDRFARIGEPGDETLAWPRYMTATDQHLVLDLQPEVGTHRKRDECDF